MNSQLKMVDRDTWLLQRAANRTVMHVGCTDAPLTKSKAEKNQLLHQKLGKVCKELIGVDLESASLDYLRRQHGIDNLYCHDIERLESFPRQEKVDVVIAGEVLEHLNNVGLFFESCGARLKKDGCVLVTVPNALSIKRIMVSLVKRKEHVHPDHTSYFSPSTLSCIAHRHKLNLSGMSMYLWRNPTVSNRLANAIARAIIFVTQFPLLADGIVAEFRPDVPGGEN
ncbi:MAG TPA: methyltransferase domain-containing protein [Candidatus Sulfotelmatobacter sp.]|jgi:SAM-dependent methyltransferase|nr:methyltransferase domain-containing protein [Candidatus Sulfotelmatobacter sp.]